MINEIITAAHCTEPSPIFHEPKAIQGSHFSFLLSKNKLGQDIGETTTWCVPYIKA
jgi:hypothetical protein